MKNEIDGGLADNKTLKDIAEKHNVDIETLEVELAKGLEVEKEHTNDESKAKEIALDHLFEIADYYTKLAKIENSSSTAEIYYAKHIEAGVVGYGDKKLLIENETLKQIMPSFIQKPVYVLHQEIEANEIKQKADGYVIESFYNPLDGSFWVKFLAISDEAQNRIKEGWSVSNSYYVTNKTESGVKNEVKHDGEILDGYYDHLAIVPNPRYTNAVIMTAPEYKEHCRILQSELEKLQNSKEKERKITMFDFFKKTKLENSDEMKDLCIKLENGQELTLEDASKLLNSIDKIEVEGETFTRAEIVDQLQNAKKELEEMKAKCKNEDEKDEDDSEDETEDEKNFKKLENSINKGEGTVNPVIIESTQAMLQRGKELY
jgi:hypothetical protein